ncbi:acetyltransferase family protein [Blastocystis sp. subtype 4]|uniref:acetyltransferase family protein n=1 Tax=Blastocystis sp. subtype 4 TaxID=944170 RepID=UPI0007117BE6|nr:acetyltransferase family protein [Blastocystis sp. subtype 4]KNB42911.1 acetyltransferase family protein [Blastocystis sp. subtype 4]|eukprot:XP_014526354.1 acetyltransferase family protein [Blastocystis sp. subtype 4]
MKISYSIATVDDAKAISAVIVSTLLSTSASQYPKSEIDRMLEINTPDMIVSQFPEYTFICAKDQDAIVGVGSVNCDSLKRLFVLKEMGIASTILQQLITIHNQEYPSYPITLTGTEMARHLYEKHGFVVVEEIHDPLRGELYYMRLSPILS